MEQRWLRWLPVLVVVLAVSLLAVVTTGPGFTGRTLPPPPGQGVEERPHESEQPLLPRGRGGGAVEESASLVVAYWIFVVVMGLLAAVLIGYLIYHGVRWLISEPVRRKEITGQAASQPDAEAEAAEVRDALRAGLADIDAGGDARRAIIACWLRLERIAAAAGTARLAADTPADLVTRLLSRHLVSRQSLEGLADAYRLARYAPHDVGDHLVGMARRALQEVDAALGEPATAEVRR